jgi:transcriptional regulator with XRE-family HTH domain
VGEPPAWPAGEASHIEKIVLCQFFHYRFFDSGMLNCRGSIEFSIAGGLVNTGEFIKRARERAGLSQSQLAQRSGIPQPTLNGLEKARDCKYSALEAVAEGVGERLKLVWEWEEIEARAAVEEQGKRNDGKHQWPAAPVVATTAVFNPYDRPTAHQYNCDCYQCRIGRGEKL